MEIDDFLRFGFLLIGPVLFGVILKGGGTLRVICVGLLLIWSGTSAIATRLVIPVFSGESMSAGLYIRGFGKPGVGDVVLAKIKNAEAQQQGIERGYLRTARSVDDAYVFKFVVGCIGDRVEMRDGTVFINGCESANLTTNDSHGRLLECFYLSPVILRESEFWLSSSFIGNSWDSRYFGVAVDAKRYWKLF